MARVAAIVSWAAVALGMIVCRMTSAESKKHDQMLVLIKLEINLVAAFQQTYFAADIIRSMYTNR